MIVGLEGPAGAGKSTMAATVAAEIGAVVLEGGAWYRALTYLAQREGVGSDDTAALIELAKGLNLTLQIDPRSGASNLMLEGRDVTAELYREQVSVGIPAIARQLEVREIVEAQIQAEIRRHSKIIFVGRHLDKYLPGTSILKLSIDEAEAERRHQNRHGQTVTQVAHRNSVDKKVAQLLGLQPVAAQAVDVTNLSKEEQAELLRAFIREHSA